jgi:hypothetical protein
MPVTVTRDSHYCTCLGHLWCYDKKLKRFYLRRAAQGGQGKYSHVSNRWRYHSDLCQWKHCLSNQSCESITYKIVLKITKRLNG